MSQWTFSFYTNKNHAAETAAFAEEQASWHAFDRVCQEQLLQNKDKDTLLQIAVDGLTPDQVVRAVALLGEMFEGRARVTLKTTMRKQNLIVQKKKRSV